MSGSGYKSRRRDSGVIPFADESPFASAKLKSIIEGKSAGNSGENLHRTLNRLKRQNSNAASSAQTAGPSGENPGISERGNGRLPRTTVQTNIAIEEDS